MAYSKLSAFFSLLAVFCSGLVVGVVGYRAYTAKVVISPRPGEKKQPDPEEVRKQLIAQMTRDVNLDPDQVQKLGQVYDQTRERFHGVRKEYNDKSRAIWDDQIQQIRSFLRPDQIVLYDKLRAKREAEREENGKQGRRKGPGPPGIKQDH